MAIYFLRHGQSKANAKHVFAGQRDDSHLTALGKRQARAAIINKHLKVDRIIASPMSRTRQTAIEVARELGFKVKNIELDDRITEYDMGLFTGTRIRELTRQELVLDPTAESLDEFHRRINSFLKYCLSLRGEVLIVSHSGVAIAIEAMKQGLRAQSFYGLPLYPNAHIVKLDLAEWI